MAVDIKKASTNVLPLLKIGGGVAATYAGYKLLQKFGLIDSQELKQIDKYLKLAGKSASVFTPGNKMLGFKPQYLRTLADAWNNKYASTKGRFNSTFQFATVKMPGATTLKQKVNLIIEKLEDAKGTFSDNEVSLYSVFKTMNTTYQLTVVSTHFKLQTGNDLLEYIKGFTNEDELLNVLNIVNRYKTYLVPK